MWNGLRCFKFKSDWYYKQHKKMEKIINMKLLCCVAVFLSLIYTSSAAVRPFIFPSKNVFSKK